MPDNSNTCCCLMLLGKCSFDDSIPVSHMHGQAHTIGDTKDKGVVCPRRPVRLQWNESEAMAGEEASEGGVAGSGRTVRASKNFVLHSGIGQHGETLSR